MGEGGNNTRVTVAVLGERVSNLTEAVREWRDEAHELHTKLTDGLGAHAKLIGRNDKRIEVLDNRLTERTGRLAMLNAAIAAAFAAVAGWFGARN